MRADLHLDETQTPTDRRRRLRATLALLWFVTAILWSPWGVDWLLGSASIEASRFHSAALGASSLMAGAAALALFRSPTRRALKVHTALITTLLIGPLLGECLLRACLFADVGNLREPKLFADPYADDDYWKLKRRWASTVRTRPDEEIGWITPTLPRNPLGVIRPPGYEPQTEDVVLCFGDSFMEGLTPFPGKIPDILEERLNGPTVYNYGVGGYGVGQMYLRFLRAHPSFVDPVIVVGILTRDLDRTILSVRGAPKPRFRVEGDELIYEAPKQSRDPEGWDAEYPPEIRSYLLSLIVRRVRLQGSDAKADELEYRREEKCRVNRALIEAFVDEARRHDLPILFITFPPSRKFGGSSWRDEFLEATFTALEVPWIDGRKPLRVDMRANGRKPSDYFRPDNHPNELGNQVFAEAIADRLRRMRRGKGR